MRIHRALAIMSALVGAALVQSEARAQDVNQVYVAPEVGYALPVDGDVNSAVFLGAKVGYQLDTNWSAEAEAGWARFGWDATEASKNIDTTTIPVLGNLRYTHRCSKEELGWYGYGGAGWGFNDAENNAGDIQVDDSFIWQLGGGVEMPVDTNLDAFLDLRYLWNRADVEEGTATGVSDDVVLSSVMLTAGLKF